MEWFCVNCYEFNRDTVCDGCGEWSETASLAAIMAWERGENEESVKEPIDEKKINWYRLLMTGKRR